MILTVLFWGGNFTFSKLAIREIPPLPFTALRFAVGAVIVVTVLFHRHGVHRPPPELLKPLILWGVIGNTIYQLCFIHGLARTSATNASLILAGLPTVVTVAGGVLGLEQTSARHRWGLAAATAGVLLVVLARNPGAEPTDLVGDALMVAAIGCWTAYSLGIRTVAGRMNALGLTAWTLLTGTPGLVLVGLPGLVTLDWGRISATAWVGVGYATLLSLVASYFLWSRSIQAIGAARTAMYSCAVPLVAAIIAIGVLGERPTVAHLVGGALIVGGVWVSQWVRTPPDSVGEAAGSHGA
jgi:drug/metabolite transporter (DMT)-like permease